MNKKRILGILGASLLFMTGLSPFSREVQNSISMTVSAQTQETYENITYRIYDTHATVYRGSKTATNIVIPSEINGYSVTAVENGAFYDCTSLTSVSIPDSITIIGDNAFYGCTSLQEVKLPDGITTIGENYRDAEAIRGENSSSSGAFGKCKALKSIVLPKNLKNIEPRTFSGCDSLESITIPDGVQKIGNSAFYGCKQMKSITIPESVMQIDSSALGIVSITEKVADFTIYGVSGSAAETYALENGFTFEEIGSAPSTEPSSSETVVGDFNGDGVVNAKDAAIILVYAATVGAGNFKGTLPEFVKTL